MRSASQDSRTPDFWYVGENVGYTHAWFRARAESSRVPAALSGEWEYMPLSNRVAGNRDMVWNSDDSTIRLGALQGKDKHFNLPHARQ